MFAGISGIASLISGVGKCINDPKEDKSEHEAANRTFRIAAPIFIVSLLLTIFVPSKPELYMIFGVGSAIDYLQSSDAAKQLPDKTLNVLNRMCDEYLTNEPEHVSDN
ncbi:MAG: hypothetical protein J6V44_11565 [Methanobrevibacter sp.]|nr:hypothetical protein [Methanobrevibacter sp.]